MNLLHDKIFMLKSLRATPEHVTLPGLFARWSDENFDTTYELAGLRSHQRGAVEAFFAGLAAHALDVAGETALPADEGKWRSMLEALTPGSHSSFWTLVADKSQPAFMQAPVPANLNSTATADSPDGIDNIPTSKNFDVKKGLYREPDLCHWIFALITLQTTRPYAGSGHYGTFHMNSGYGTRLFCAVYTEPSEAGRWRQDARRLPAHWASVLSSEFSSYNEGGARLLALLPWDPTTSVQLSLKDLHPGVLEVSAPIRLETGENGRLIGKIATSKAMRVKDVKGLSDDPWAPLVRKKAEETTALNHKADGFGIDAVIELLLRDQGMEHSPFMTPPAGDAPYLMVRALCCGGAGLVSNHAEHMLPIKPRAAISLFARQAVPAFRTLYTDMMKESSGMARTCQKALGAGLNQSENSPLLKSETKKLTNRLHDSWRIFALGLIQDVAAGELALEDARARFSENLLVQARNILGQSIAEVALPQSKRYEATALATLEFNRLTARSSNHAQ